MEEKNYYDILQVSRNASPEIIDKAYKTLVKKYHPDLSFTDDQRKTFEQILKNLNEAYAVLSNEHTRKLYDKSLDEKYISKNKYEDLFTENEELRNRLSTFDKSELKQSKSKKNKKNSNKSDKKIFGGSSFLTYWFSYFSSNFKTLQTELKNNPGDVNSDTTNDNSQYEVSIPKTTKILLISVLSFIGVVLIFYLLNLIPSVHSVFSNIYNGNSIVRFFVDIITGTFGIN